MSLSNSHSVSSVGPINGIDGAQRLEQLKQGRRHISEHDRPQNDLTAGAEDSEDKKPLEKEVLEGKISGDPEKANSPEVEEPKSAEKLGESKKSLLYDPNKGITDLLDENSQPGNRLDGMA